MENLEVLEKNLLTLLKEAKAPAGMLKRTSASLAAVGKTDVEFSRVLINGIPYPKWLVFKGRMKADSLGSLQGLFAADLIREIKLEPHGIGTPRPDFDVTLRLNLNGHARP